MGLGGNPKHLAPEHTTAIKAYLLSYGEQGNLCMVVWTAAVNRRELQEQCF